MNKFLLELITQLMFVLSIIGIVVATTVVDELWIRILIFSPCSIGMISAVRLTIRLELEKNG